MRVRVRYFADAREATRLDREEFDLPSGACVSEAVAAMVRLHPALAPVAARSRVAVGERFAQPDEKLAEGATVALIPPVGGG